MLFPSERQVTHALLTRPPLFHRSIDRSLFRNFIVRLACVKHAASVRPEPGSNSLKTISKHRMVFKPFLELNRSFCQCWLTFFNLVYRNLCCTFCSLAKLLEIFSGFFISSLFNFQGACRCSIPHLCASPQGFPRDSFVIISNTTPFVNTFFEKFLRFFFLFQNAQKSSYVWYFLCILPSRI